MSLSGDIWVSRDVLTAVRLNTKTLTISNAAPSTTYAGMLWRDSNANKLYSMNDANGAWLEYVDLTSSQTLTSKTLTSPTLTTPAINGVVTTTGLTLPTFTTGGDVTASGGNILALSNLIGNDTNGLTLYSSQTSTVQKNLIFMTSNGSANITRLTITTGATADIDITDAHLDLNGNNIKTVNTLGISGTITSTIGSDNLTLVLSPTAATSGAQLKVSPYVAVTAAYWDGGASVEKRMILQNVMDAANSYYFAIKQDGGNTKFKLWDSGNLDIVGRLLTGAGVTLDTTGTAAEGNLRYNTTLNLPEIYDGSVWKTTAGIIIKYKTANESVSSSTVYQDDDHLAGWSLLANGIYLLEGEIIVNTGANSYKIQLETTQNMTVKSIAWYGQSLNYHEIIKAESANVTTHEIISGENSGTYPLRIWALIVMGGTSGTLDIQWAENVSGGTTTLEKYSWVRLTQV